MRKVMEANIQLPNAIWERVGYAWMAFLAAMGALNLFVAFVVFKADTGAWVSFKLFGFTAIFFVFVFVQMLFLSKHIKEEDA
jgi:intracellular septation protein